MFGLCRNFIKSRLTINIFFNQFHWKYFLNPFILTSKWTIHLDMILIIYTINPSFVELYSYYITVPKTRIQRKTLESKWTVPFERAIELELKQQFQVKDCSVKLERLLLAEILQIKMCGLFYAINKKIISFQTILTFFIYLGI